MVSCLNEDAHYPVANLFKKDGSYLQSDTDPQLLVSVPFAEPVCIAGLRIEATAGDEEAPARVKLFTNRPDIGFDEAESDEPLQSFELALADTKAGAPALELRRAKFRSVHSLQLFVEENYGADVTRLTYLHILGEAKHSGSGDGFGLPIPAGFKLDAITETPPSYFS
ncbi:unnamed protein product [Prorocentrum cordatum]|uniref:PITH domain-containing protein n=1 Tax=Prorocentrum cordatum TaxID=2364126 RepID=A0ABN9U495_9DINO|nr:unnamed protein product [Polarella glacialis]|mmetsp:Transcript_115600/g.309968  ORF Transcript_115600/g.309968 Transcript_115600/m.309968 type:complete len:168 (-) Transcript_115600:59-562(-)